MNQLSSCARTTEQSLNIRSPLISFENWILCNVTTFLSFIFHWDLVIDDGRVGPLPKVFSGTFRRFSVGQRSELCGVWSMCKKRCLMLPEPPSHTQCKPNTGIVIMEYVPFFLWPNEKSEKNHYQSRERVLWNRFVLSSLPFSCSKSMSTHGLKNAHSSFRNNNLCVGEGCLCIWSIGRWGKTITEAKIINPGCVKPSGTVTKLLNKGTLKKSVQPVRQM